MVAEYEGSICSQLICELHCWHEQAGVAEFGYCHFGTHAVAYVLMYDSVYFLDPHKMWINLFLFLFYYFFFSKLVQTLPDATHPGKLVN